MALHHYPRIVTDGLRCHLDVGVRRSYPGGDTWYDLTSYGNNGVLAHGAILTQTGHTAGAGHMDLSAGEGDAYIKINDAPSLNWTDHELTITAWANRLDIDWEAEETMVGKAVNGNNYDSQFALNFYYSTKIRNLIRTDGTDGWNNTNDLFWNTDPVGSFHSYSMVYDGAVLAGYQDGNRIAVGTDPTVTGDINVEPAPVLIGTRYDVDGNNPYRNFNGFIDIVLIYKKALSSTEIQQNYNALKWRFQ
tara:strand:- start:5 stop:748 length:744 start_codon:yes stop_codon:yes gene_type:complete